MSSKINVNAEYTLDDLGDDVHRINETVQNHKASVIMYLAANYELMEATMLIKFKNITQSTIKQLQVFHSVH